MKTTLKFLAASALFFSLGTTAHSQVVVKVKPDRPVKIVKKSKKVRKGHIWVDGHWKWNKRRNKYVWVEGNWVKKRRGYKYKPGSWVKTRGGYKWKPAIWIKL
ncbi:YXWGXW repeat-containing protein [Xanthovirga aplysinae]|uniref:YXWGXW repeat-containing protein n=1 Tax=Xanthovirga aplysinae TaxID=2529853 RepID=UPI0012BC99AA|nr:YXWGXW repeat-containing protein [Xanthovirga aplysinae]MTI32452.1 hypothetical protein [Xanthovirga aplysinae]